MSNANLALVQDGTGEIIEAEVIPTLAVEPTEYRARILQLREFVRSEMVAGEDYGIIPGTQKPTLYKAGAEKLNWIFALSPEVEILDKEIDWETPFICYEVKVTLRNNRTGQVAAEGVGSCNSREKKYIKQQAADVANTILKMAKKRALVDATLSATRASGLFTQDVEDMDLSGDSTPRQASQRPRASQAQQAAPRPRQDVKCHKCHGAMWDNRERKQNPNAPDFKCKNKNCDGVIWPPRDTSDAPAEVTFGSIEDDPQRVGGVDEHGYVWCACGKHARYITKNGVSGWVCADKPQTCKYRLTDTGQDGLVRPSASRTVEAEPESTGDAMADLCAYFVAEGFPGAPTPPHVFNAVKAEDASIKAVTAENVTQCKQALNRHYLLKQAQAPAAPETPLHGAIRTAAAFAVSRWAAAEPDVYDDADPFADSDEDDYTPAAEQPAVPQPALIDAPAANTAHR